MSTYAYRREDTDEIIQVDWETNMSADIAGFVTLPDGTKARRCSSPMSKRSFDGSLPLGAREVVSTMTLGFPQQQLAEFEADRVKNGFTDVRFERDPDVPEYINVHCDNAQAYARYYKHRGYDGEKSCDGAQLTPEQLEAAKVQVKREIEERIARRAAAGLD